MAEGVVAVLLPDPEAPESVRCQSLADGTYVIRDVPVFSNRFGFADVITASQVGDTLTAQRIVDSAGWSTYVLEPSGDIMERDALLLLKDVERFGALVQLRVGRVVSVGVPTRTRNDVLSLFQQGTDRGLWIVSVIRDSAVEALGAAS